MSATKKPVNTPLHLLQQLSSSLLEHLEDACSQALADAEKLLAKLENNAVKLRKNCTNPAPNFRTPPLPAKPRRKPKQKTAWVNSKPCSMR